ncbi:MAG: iron ABC transporter permease [Dehalococcoidales bacterium]|nr:MAG: iron ABC transporter permease [Dehalococcoidales bacterium]
MRWQKYLLPSVIFLVLLVFVVYPTLSVLVKSLSVGERIGLDNYIDAFTKPQFASTIWGSLLVAAGAAVLSTVLGLIISLTVFKTTLPLRRFFSVAAVLPMIIPGFVSTLAYIFLFGRNGLITYKLLGVTWDIYSWKSVLFIQTLDFTTITFLIISAVMLGVDRQVEDAARNLGASEWEVMKTVTLPLIRPGIIGALLLVFLRSMADFGTPLILGGRFDTLASASYSQLIGTYNMGMASTLNAILLLICLVVFWFYSRVQATGSRVRLQVESGQPREIDLKRPLKATLWSVCLLFSSLVFMILVSVFLASFTRHLGADFSFTLEHFRIVPQRGWNSIMNTIVFASITSLVMSLVGLVIAYLVTRIQFKGRNLIDLLTTLPFALPGTLMGVGYILAFNHAPFLLTGTWAIVIAVTVIRELPLGLRSGVSVLGQQDRSIEDASASLGASRLSTFFRIVMPLSRPALVVSALYAFVATVQTVGAIIFVINPSNKVLSVDVFEAIYRGDVGDAAALSMVMLLLAALGVLAIFAISQRGVAQTWVHRVLTHHASAQ